MNTSFGTSNKFAVLQVQQPKPKGDKLVNSIPGPAPSVKSKDDSEKEKQTNVSDNRNNNNNNRGRGENRGRGGRGGNRGGRGGSRVDRAAEDRARDPNQPPKRNKRIYDRNSNVPKNETKKSGGGAANWGNEKEDPQRGADDAKKEIVAEGEQAAEVKQEDALPVEPVDNTITLKQYQDQLAALAPKIDLPKRREAGEGEKNDLHKYVVLKKEDDEERVIIKAKKDKKKKEPKKQTVPLSDLLSVNSGDSDRRYKKNYNNNNYNKKKNVKVTIPIEDIDSFPALK